jgi:linoleoyl-CoA desaturase
LTNNSSLATEQVQSPKAALSRSLGELRREFARRGWTRKPTARLLAELAGHLTFMFGGAALYLLSSSWLLHLAGLMISAFGCVGIASNSHTSSHYGTSSKRWVNEALTFFGYSFCLGLSSLFWWSDHNEHHAAPNVRGLDDDFDYAPLFTIDAQEYERSTGWKRWYYGRLQAFLLLPAVSLMGFNLQRRGIQVLCGDHRNSRGKWALRTDITLLILHVLVLLVLPSLYFGAATILGFYALRMLFVGVGLFSILAPAHFPQEAAILEQDAAGELSHCELQTITTVNYTGGPILRWITSGLGYQIEHHLFPEISHTYYREMSPVVAEFCRANDLPYRSYKFPRALRESFRVFRTPK